MILKLILIALAAICKAMVDTIAFHNGGRFKGNDFFDINKQGKMFPLTKYPFDAFHLFNSLMIFFFIAASLFIGTWYIDIAAMGVVFIIIFNTFFNHIFKQKKS